MRRQKDRCARMPSPVAALCRRLFRRAFYYMPRAVARLYYVPNINHVTPFEKEVSGRRRREWRGRREAWREARERHCRAEWRLRVAGRQPACPFSLLHLPAILHTAPARVFRVSPKPRCPFNARAASSRKRRGVTPCAAASRHRVYASVMPARER